MTFSMLPNLLFSLLLLLPLVSAVTTSTLELCSTEYGGSSISPVPSITYTENTSQHLTAKTTITPTVTVTPKPVTVQSTSIEVKTVTSYSTTVTFTDTDTVEVYITSTDGSSYQWRAHELAEVNSQNQGTTTDTAFVTSTTTTTEPTPTSTVPTPSGFTYPPPVPSPPAQRKRYEARPILEERKVVARAVEERAATHENLVQQAYVDPAEGKIVQSPAQYPTSVLCTKTLDTIYTTILTKTASSTHTNTAPTPTITKVHTIISTSTTSLYESFAETTITTTQTATILTYITSISTSSTTETATLIPPTATQYAACDAPNILVPPAGYFFSSEAYNPPSFQVTVDLPQNTTYDCCVACITTANCKIAMFFEAAAFEEVTCSLSFGDNESVCDAEHIDVGIGGNPSGYVSSFSVGLCEGTLGFSYED
ncbi:MAG: hypothetical protein MMC33_009359 [Icmadophila ericetorum]|nr:hypothetical protein [Icmadophila ericetorum]